MKRYAFLALMVSLFPVSGFCLTGDLPQGDTTLIVSPKDPSTPEMVPSTVVGTAVTVDAVKQTLKVQDKAGGTKSFVINSDVPIYDVQRHLLSFADLKVGAALSVHYDPTTAHVIEIDAN